ncbi:hypothetical protein L210DRAFT_2628303 [Boletus edulis BED1]|uniref:DUF6534 domain-containing protein n=1 Tax=Boletus edulis BED1 TaxID=1328754 RepID=A0AAD4C4G4_BOLED|nr:hypothetical protein L210DRAFT_2628303 [Boletus edulis BED1]
MAANPLIPPFGPMCGPLYFSTALSTALYGITCMQTFFYYVHYENDLLRMKFFVATVWVLNTVHEALIVTGTFKYIMGALVNRDSLLHGVPELVLQLPFAAMVAVTTQGFFVYRIYIFNGKNIVVPLIFVPLAIYQLVSTLIYVRMALYSADGVTRAVGLLVLGDPFFMGMATSTLATAAALDVSIAVFLTYLLLRKQSVTGYASTIQVLHRLTVFAVNAGTWTATFALLSVILLHIYPSNMLYVVFVFPICSIYCNTLLANLNGRMYIRGEATTHNVDLDLFNFNSAMPMSANTNGDNRSRVVSFRTQANLDVHGLGGAK